MEIRITQLGLHMNYGHKKTSLVLIISMFRILDS